MKDKLAYIFSKQNSRYLFTLVILIVFLAFIPSVVKSLNKSVQADEASYQADEDVPEIVLASTPAPTSVPTATRPPEVTIGSLPARAAEYGAFVTVDNSYFDDALFIGDSRCVDLYKYGTLSNATFFADDGLDVFDLYTSHSKANSGDQLFDEFIHSHSFKKIYIMLGFNEMGYDRTKFIRRYSQLIDSLRETQPDAVLFLNANLLMTSKKSGERSYVTHEAVIEINNMIAALANGYDIVYIDVNPIFADAEGALDKTITGDGTHPYGKQYIKWCEWLKTRGVMG